MERTKADYRAKIDHLKMKHNKLREEEKSKVPDDVEEYKSATVFNKEKYEEIEI